MAHSARFLPMQTAGTHNLVERTYREGSQFQWVREVLVNAIEANATRVEFGIEWQAVESQRVYRRTIADNGCGMTGEQLVEFFNTFGGGGKPIGDVHGNFGVGSKTSLMPWNHYGVVVISWVDGDASMIWVAKNPETGEYGLKTEKCVGPNGEMTLEGVYDPYDDPIHGCNWANVKPAWIQDHGTVIVLLGNAPNAHTVEGDPNREETDIKGISSSINRRFWEIPNKAAVKVYELRNTERSLWPLSEAMASGDEPSPDGRDRRTNDRDIKGAKFYIEYPKDRGGGRLRAHDTVQLRDGTEVDWFLWSGERPAVHSYAAMAGYISVLYENELYDTTFHPSTYRSFGVSDSTVRSRLWLVVRPLVDPNGKHGVYPKTDRNSLLIMGGPTAGAPLPINEWAGEFADKMPDEIVAALRESRGAVSGSITDKEWKDRLADRFGSRWRLGRLRVRQGGAELLNATIDGPPRKSKRKLPVPLVDQPPSIDDVRTPRAPRPRILRFGKPGSLHQGDQTQINGGVPDYAPAKSGDVAEGILAAWQPVHPDFPGGVVWINVHHPVLLSVVEHWQAQYADHHAESIKNDVIAVYGEVAVSKIAHSEHLKGILPTQIVEKQLRSEESLTMALLGLMAEDHLISTRVGGKYSKKRGGVVDRSNRMHRIPR